MIGGLAAVGLLVWLVAPASGAATLPLLFALVCPLSMGAMAWGMRRRGGSCDTTGSATSAETAGDMDAELRELREEIAIVRARRQLTGRDGQPRG